ncbi:MAG: PQQ-binding-like beta-propeller repeat protein [Candidatus Bathyarchaeales archaeon]
MSSSPAGKSPPLFTVVDGRVLTTGDGFYCVNATNGKLIWNMKHYRSDLLDLLLRDKEWVFADGLFFIASIDNNNWYLCSLNADNGEVLWTYKVFTHLESSPIVADCRVFIGWWRQNQTMLFHINNQSKSFICSFSSNSRPHHEATMFYIG